MKKINLEQAKKLLAELDVEIEEIRKSDWNRVNNGSEFSSIEVDNGKFVSESFEEEDCKLNKNYHMNNNYCTNKNKLQRIADEFNLKLAMEKFADENNEGKFDWKDNDEKKWHLTIDTELSKLDVDYATIFKETFQVYFTTREIAEKAEEIFGKEILRIYGGA